VPSFKERQPAKIDVLLTLAATGPRAGVASSQSAQGVAANLRVSGPAIAFDQAPAAFERLTKSTICTHPQQADRSKALSRGPGINRRGAKPPNPHPSADDAKLIAEGKAFSPNLRGLHGLTGQGLKPMAPPLVNSGVGARPRRPPLSESCGRHGPAAHGWGHRLPAANVCPRCPLSPRGKIGRSRRPELHPQRMATPSRRSLWPKSRRFAANR